MYTGLYGKARTCDVFFPKEVGYQLPHIQKKLTKRLQMSTIHNTPIETFKQLAKESISFSDLLRKLNLSTNGSTNHNNLKDYIKNYNINIEHFSHTVPNRKPNNSYTLAEILVKDSKYTNRGRLKERLIRENYLPYQCNICELNCWNNLPIALQLDHINGIPNDNRIENLRLLCPNCHSQTDTYAGKNRN